MTLVPLSTGLAEPPTAGTLKLVASDEVAVISDHGITSVAAAPTATRMGDALLREYLLPFEVASVVLLMALVGAMVIARRAVKEELGQDPRNPEEGRG